MTKHSPVELTITAANWDKQSTWGKLGKKLDVKPWPMVGNEVRKTKPATSRGGR